MVISFRLAFRLAFLARPRCGGRIVEQSLSALDGTWMPWMGRPHGEPEMVIQSFGKKTIESPMEKWDKHGKTIGNP